jgi:hypothetical protein
MYVEGCVTLQTLLSSELCYKNGLTVYHYVQVNASMMT